MIASRHQNDSVVRSKSSGMDLTPKSGVFKNRFQSIDLRGKSVLELSDEELRALVLDKLWDCGVVCVKKQDLNPSEMKLLAARIGSPILLPAAFSFENRDPENMEIVRIGNIRNDGTVVPKVTAAEYWHHDGNFWGVPGYQIVNLLHAKVIPPVGGNTGFMDTTLALHELFDEETRTKLRQSTALVSCDWISDFKNAKPEDKLPDVTIPCVPNHPVTNKQVLYLPFTPKGLYNQVESKHWISNDDIWDMMVSNGYTYEHKYEEGDLLLWDNIQVMHRSLGGYGDHPRLLYRAQARYNQSDAKSKL